MAPLIGVSFQGFYRAATRLTTTTTQFFRRTQSRNTSYTDGRED